MKQELNLVLSPEDAANEAVIKQISAQQIGIKQSEITSIKILKHSIDARSRNIKINLKVELFINEIAPSPNNYKINYPNVSAKKPVIIVGAGPAGLFAAFQLIENGLKPIIIERGKDVKSRRRDLAAINKEHIVNPDSNYCFGEGGAGTYSDGKLYTRATKRGDVNRILDIMIAHGAKPDIAIDAHPHIGTNKLPKLIEAIRQTIKNAGGEIIFETRVTDLLIVHGNIVGVKTQKGYTFEGKAVILATGHSARDIFELLHKKEILMEAKPFALGVRIEHPQQIIDSVQYHCEKRSELLPAASYSLAHQVNGRGVYSFCMCPGGFIVPAATGPNEVVVNGMSPSRRDSKFANSGMVVAVELEDLKEFQKQGIMASLRYQQMVEKAAYIAGGSSQVAPAQRMVDFVNKKLSSSLPETSYQPGTRSVLMHEVLPIDIATRLQEGFKAFGKKMPRYYTNEAIILGVESRTSSPIRIPRDDETLQHPQVKGLYPCGEGAGYAGGIVSAAMDGERCAEASYKYIV